MDGTVRWTGKLMISEITLISLPKCWQTGREPIAKLRSGAEPVDTAKVLP